MLTRDLVRQLLSPFELNLSGDHIEALLQYLDLLMRWNQKINLTALRSAEECVTRHFGESLLLSCFVPLRGRLLDIGSGAGFPGLAIKLVAPDLDVLLLEPVTKKRAFLKEVARVCRMRSVRVEGKRIEDFSHDNLVGVFDIITVRAVGSLDSVIVNASPLLSEGGSLCLWVGADDARAIRRTGKGLIWTDPVPIPLSNRRVILVAQKPAMMDG